LDPLSVIIFLILSLWNNNGIKGVLDFAGIQNREEGPGLRILNMPDNTQGTDVPLVRSAA
jgi:hypothetical protein